MTPLTVFTPLPPAVPTTDVAALLTAAGLIAAATDQWIAQCPSGDGAPVLLVVISNNPSAALALETAVRAAVTRGERVIAVWPEGSAGTSLPSVLQDYGAGLVAWNASAIHEAICKRGEEWQDAGGGTREALPLDRNKNC